MDYSGNAVLPDVASDPSGNAIAVWMQAGATGMNIVSSRFSAGSGWSIARVIETESEESWLPQVAMDASGNAMVVWTNDPDEYYAGLPARVWANRYDVAIGWGESTLIGGTGNAVEVQIALDPQGNGIATWIESDDGSIWASRYVPAAGWGVPVSIHQGATGSPRVAMDSDGNAVVVWVKWDGNSYHVYANRFAPGTGWSTPLIIDSAGGKQPYGLSLAGDSAGGAAVSWTEWSQDVPSTSVWANRFVPGIGWEGASLVDLGGFDSEIAMNSAGGAIVTWNRWEGDGFFVWASHHIGSAWTQPVRLGGSVGGSSTHPKIAMGSQGNTIVAWEELNPSRREKHISASMYSVGNGWGGETTVFEHAGVDGSPAVVTLSPAEALVLWVQRIGIRSTIFANRYDFSAGWSVPVRVDTGASRDAFAPRIVAAGQSNAIAVWSQGDGTRYGLWANRDLEDGDSGTSSRIETNAGDALNPQVGVDTQGNTMVVWQQWRGLQRALWAARYVVGAGWGASAVIDGADNASDAQVAVDSLGNAIVTWREWMGADYAVRASRYEVGVGWSEAVEIGTQTGGASPPKIAVNGPGSAVVVWAGDAGIWANRYEVGTGWGSPALIGPKNSTIFATFDPQVDVDPAGRAIAVWSASGIWDSGISGVYANQFVPGSGWGGAALVASGIGTGAQIAMDSKGNAFLVWLEGSCGRACYITSSRYAVGLGWEPPERLDAIGGWSPAVAVDPNGNATVVWINRGIWAKRFVVGTGWNDATYVGGSNVDPWLVPSVQIAADSAGNAYAVWQEMEGDRLGLWASHYTPQGLLSDIPSGLEDVLRELAFVRSIAFAAFAGLLALVVVVFLQYRVSLKTRHTSAAPPPDEVTSRGSNAVVGRDEAPSAGNALVLSDRPQAGEKRWPAQNALKNGVHLIAKERILLHLLHFARYADAPEVPPDLTQGRTTEAAGIDRRHYAQYVRPMIEDGLVRERTTHVRGVVQRRRVYVLTEEGRRKAMEIRDRIRSVVVRVRDASGERDVTIAEALLEARGSLSILDILRESIETGVVDLSH